MIKWIFLNTTGYKIIDRDLKLIQVALNLLLCFVSQTACVLSSVGGLGKRMRQSMYVFLIQTYIFL